MPICNTEFTEFTNKRNIALIADLDNSQNPVLVPAKERKCKKISHEDYNQIPFCRNFLMYNW